MENRQRHPLKLPDRREVSKSLQTLWEQQIHVYQLLFFNKMTNPHGYPLRVRRDLTYNKSNPTALIVVERLDTGLYFKTDGYEGDENILRKAKMVIESTGKKDFPMACCEYAKPVPCVCAANYRCELHGESHIGTHD